MRSIQPIGIGHTVFFDGPLYPSALEIRSAMRAYSRGDDPTSLGHFAVWWLEQCNKGIKRLVSGDADLTSPGLATHGAVRPGGVLFISSFHSYGLTPTHSLYNWVNCRGPDISWPGDTSRS